MPDVPEIQESEVRPWTDRAASDDYFRALVSEKLTSDRIPDDDLMDTIASNPLLVSIYDDLYKTPMGKAKITKAIQDSCPGYSDSLAPYVAGRVVWAQAVDDPRFGLILKEALNELRIPPMRVRSSQAGRIAAILGKIRDALISAGGKHSNATLLASILAALLVGGATVHLLPSVSGGGSMEESPANNDKVTAALNNIAHQIQVQNVFGADLGRLDVQVTGQGDQLGDLRTDSATLNVQFQQQSKQISSINQTIVDQSVSLQTLQKNYTVLTNSVKWGQPGMIEQYLHQIANGLAQPLPSPGAPAPKGVSQDIPPRLIPTIQASVDSIAQSFGPVPGSIPNPADPKGPAIPVISLNQAVALSRNSTSKSYADYMKSYSGYLDSQPKPFRLDKSLYTKRRDTVVATQGGNDCQLALEITSVTLKKAGIQTDGCGVTTQVEMVLDNQRKRVPGTDIELRFETPYKPRIWPFKPRGAVISVYFPPKSN
ncbi:hypothetical protein EDE15_3562 [Edaphobacter aggregans]|uniref:Uncharacterized protein n=2 Tax=Edaphobacter aggregans TaxID=570835 RepID=A0A428MM83_9BACT|nr:hypothetical protein EDE15_3562 [Edaphobacter aggregans]